MDLTCPRCGLEGKFLEHLILKCLASMDVWTRVGSKFNLQLLWHSRDMVAYALRQEFLLYVV